MHSALRPKPQSKQTYSTVIPSTLPNQKTHQNGHLSKPLHTNGNGYHHHSTQQSLSSTSSTTLERYQNIPSLSSSQTAFQWSLGLINSKGKYLTSENFGCKINATGNSLRKKQKWIIHYNIQDDVIYLMSPLNYYLSTDKYGRLTCDKLTPDIDCQYQLEFSNHPLTNGRWAFKSVVYGMFLGGDGDHLHCFSKTPEWWLPHLALHPHINLKHILRKRYARLDENEIHIDEIVPWGSNALITVEYCDDKYAIRTCDRLYFHKEGKLIQQCTDESLFTIELNKGYLAFKDCEHRYLTAVGPQGIMTTRNKVAGKDELFLLEESKLQVCFTAHNGKLVSIKQGIDVSANQTEISDSGIFQLEYDDKTAAYHIRTCNNKYWKLEGNGVQATGEKNMSETSFQIQSLNDGRIAFQAPNGKYIVPHPTGHMRAVSDTPSTTETFLLKFINRPIIVLKCDYGLVGYRNKTCYKLECNKSTFHVFQLENDHDGTYYLKGSHGLYWELLNDSSISVSGREPSKFSIELCQQNRIIIKAPNGQYLKGEQNGSMTTCSTINQATSWEF
ncbi:unnamed protein product [Didymodactylos carnosus]|uniref:Fascin-like domain-containing protein n=1 Tax=Didymodactylos carnosus TaxID=1234261 RepID=A0A815M5M7_9BILA|nr:unnamed protein product [Didymodactylos carnosus]CAF4303233.1 unnamed protein product [Didymodactylos carnosus]